MGVKFLSVLSVFLFTALSASAQGKAELSFCGKTGNQSMTWEEFSACKKELVAIDKNLKINSFIVLVGKAEKKDTVWTEYISKGSTFSKTAIEAMEKLHKNKKMSNTIKIEAVEILQSGRDGRKVPGMTITLK
jgi:hypothetical protein